MEISELKHYKFGKDAPKKEEVRYRYPSFYAKTMAGMVDFFIVTFIRLVAAAIVMFFWFSKKIEQLRDHVSQPSDLTIEFLIKFRIIEDLLIMFCVVIVAGGFYYIFSYASKWQGTLGSFLFDIKMVNIKTGERISFLRSSARYLLSLVPIVLVIFMFLRYYRVPLDGWFILMFIVCAVWYDLSLIIKIPQGMHDLLTRTVLISVKPTMKK